MRLHRRLMIAGAVLTVVLGTTVTAVSASPKSQGSNQGRGVDLLRSALIGRPGDASTTVIRGVAPGGVAWALSRGTIRINGAGRLRLEVEGLVITGTNSVADGTTGPVKAVVASLTCEGTVPTIVSTNPVPLSLEGDASIDQRIGLPATCLAPIVLVRANSTMGPWIAATGF